MVVVATITTIPKLVHLTYKSFDSIPSHWKPSLDKWKEFGWEVKFWSDDDNDNLINTEYSQFKDLYYNFAYSIQKVDLVRVCYLHKYGGVYCDLDLVPTVDLFDKLQNDCSLLCSPVDGKTFTNMFMAGVKQHPFWMFYLNAMRVTPPFWALGKHLHVMFTTGPSLMNIAVKDFMKKYPTTKIVVLNRDWIKCDVCKVSACNEGLLKVVKGQSWNSWDSKVYGWVWCNKKIVIAIISILFLLIVLRILSGNSVNSLQKK